MKHETASLLGAMHKHYSLLYSLSNVTEIQSEMASYRIRVLLFRR